MHWLGTIFSGGLIHIWCSSECLWQEDGVCVSRTVLLDMSGASWPRGGQTQHSLLVWFVDRKKNKEKDQTFSFIARCF